MGGILGVLCLLGALGAGGFTYHVSTRYGGSAFDTMVGGGTPTIAAGATAALLLLSIMFFVASAKKKKT